MVQEFLEKLSAELSIPRAPKLNEKKVYPLHLGPEMEIWIGDLKPGVSFQANLASCPEKRKEDLFIYLSRANLLGQGTGGARLGLTPDEKVLTLLLGLPYEMKYQAFRDAFEDFVNYVQLWRNEIEKFEKDQSIYG
jgi:hypothetical protein